MAKSAYQKLLESVFLENPMLPGPDTDQSTMGGEYSQGLSDFADDGTDKTKFQVQGVKHLKDGIVKSFMTKVETLSNGLSPENIQNETFGQIKSTINQIYKKIDGVETFTRGKVTDQDESAESIIGAYIASKNNQNKLKAFQLLHKELGDFDSAISEMESKFSVLKSKITDFIGDVSVPSEGSSPVGESVKKNINLTLKGKSRKLLSTFKENLENKSSELDSILSGTIYVGAAGIVLQYFNDLNNLGPNQSGPSNKIAVGEIMESPEFKNIRNILSDVDSLKENIQTLHNHIKYGHSKDAAIRWMLRDFDDHSANYADDFTPKFRKYIDTYLQKVTSDYPLNQFYRDVYETYLYNMVDQYIRYK
jgi:hypothetical protein